MQIFSHKKTNTFDKIIKRLNFMIIFVYLNFQVGLIKGIYHCLYLK